MRWRCSIVWILLLLVRLYYIVSSNVVITCVLFFICFVCSFLWRVYGLYCLYSYCVVLCCCDLRCLFALLFVVLVFLCSLYCFYMILYCAVVLDLLCV